MRRSLILMAAMLAAALPVFGSSEARVAIPEFKKNFTPGMTRFTREKALAEIVEVDDPDVLKAFDWALAVTKEQIRRTLIEKDETTEEVKRLEKQLDDLLLREAQRAREKGEQPGTVGVPTTLVQSIELGRRKIDGLQQDIDDEYELRDAAAESLGTWLTKLSPENGERVFRELTRGRAADRDWTSRAFFARALSAAAVPAATRLILERLADEKDRRVLPIVIDAAAAQAGEMAVPDLLRFLGDERWQIRATAVEALTKIGSPKAIPGLIARLREEDGRLRGDIRDALGKLTGQDFGFSADRWQEWWEKNRDRVTGPEGGKPGGDAGPPPPHRDGGTVSFYGIEVVSKNLLFVIDISNSMNQPASAKNPERSKVDVAKSELRNALLQLPEDATFNIVFYHHEVSQWRKGMVVAKGPVKRGALKFVEEMQAEGNTNIYDALKLAFHIVGMGATDKNYDIGADTILFLSDGQPNRGDVTDPEQILSEVKRWNLLRRVKIHTVGVGKDHATSFMKALADSSGGTYVSR